MMKTNAISPFTAIVSIIILGTALLASSTSSAMCTAASDPANEAVAVIDPTKQAVPISGHPPKFEKEVKTSLAGALGEGRAQRVAMMQTNPTS